MRTPRDAAKACACTTPRPINVKALRHWERGDCKPRGASLVLLNVIQSGPKAVVEAPSN